MDQQTLVEYLRIATALEDLVTLHKLNLIGMMYGYMSQPYIDALRKFGLYGELTS